MKGVGNMKYILMMTSTKAGVDSYKGWPAKAIETHFAFLGRFNQKLQESGEFVATQPLTGPEEAKTVRAGKDGEPITDGVFPESKEFLLGYWIVDVASPEQAYRLAAKVSAAPGQKDRGNQPIEVRQILSGPPEDLQ